ncbi:MAG TPA: immunoglobulin domain-containing protein, partial [Ferruginibacter sp.]|nr:immunoglobulin domain-containing protein [Ferruginibacter sp.]
MSFTWNTASAQGTMGRWELCGLSGTTATVSPTGVSSGVTFSVLSRGPGITAASASNAYNSTGWSTSGSLNTGNNDYYEFTITPQPGHSISLSALKIRDQMSNTSFDVFVRYGDNNYSSNLGTWTVSNTNANNRTVNLSGVTALQNRTTPVTFRVYGTDANGSSSTYRFICEGTGSGQFRGVDVDGTVTHNPYVAEFVSMSYGSSPWCQGETRDVSVTVKNVGSATWNSAEPVNIGLKWNEDVDYGASPSFIPRQPAGSVATGQTVTYTFPNVPASTLTGNNNLRFDVVRELVCWFGNNSGGCGPGNSVFVSPTINILAQPTAVTVSGGGTFCNSRTLTASGGTGGTMYFQGTDPNGVSIATPATSRVVTESGTYYFRSRSAAGCWSVAGSATVTINKDVAITTQPQNQTICEGGAINLSVTATGTPAPTYQWKKDNNDILGETNSTLSIPSAVNGDGGSYTVEVTNTCSVETSAAAVVVVNVAPAVTVDPTNETVCEGSPVTFTVTATGTNLTYQWRKGGVDIGGANASSYTIPSVVSADAGSYDVVVSNTGCTPATSAAATLTVQTAPVITVDPVGTTICEGGAINLSVTVTGTPAPTYQWKKDNNDILGETNSTLSIPSAVNGDGGSYTVEVTNTCGVETSAAAVVVVNVAPAVTVDPTNETVCEGSPVTFTVTATGTNLTYQWRKGGVDIGGANASSYTIPSVVSADAGSYDVVVSNGGCASATSAAATLTVNTLPAITVDPVDATVCEGGSINLSVTATGTPAPTYQWKKDNNDLIGETNNTLSIPSAVFADGGSYTVEVTNTCGSDLSGAAVVVVNVAPIVTVDPTDETVCEGSPVTFTVTATGTNLTYQWRKGGVDINGATASSYTISSVVSGDAGSYDVVVSNGGCTSATSVAATLTVNTVPVVTVDPVGTTICEGGAINLSVTATGTPAPTYQWKKDNNDLLGETNSTLNIASLVNADGGSYTVVVTNVCGSDESGAATVIVNVAPAVTVDPTDETVCE